MKYLFSINDLYYGTIKLYTVEAESTENAKEVFIKKFFPYIERSEFASLVDYLAKSTDIVISSLGPISQIKEL